jgi:hypothetical protein
MSCVIPVLTHGLEVWYPGLERTTHSGVTASCRVEKLFGGMQSVSFYQRQCERFCLCGKPTQAIFYTFSRRFLQLSVTARSIRPYTAPLIRPQAPGHLMRTKDRSGPGSAHLCRLVLFFSSLSLLFLLIDHFGAAARPCLYQNARHDIEILAESIRHRHIFRLGQVDKEHPLVRRLLLQARKDTTRL